MLRGSLSGAPRTSRVGSGLCTTPLGQEQRSVTFHIPESPSQVMASCNTRMGSASISFLEQSFTSPAFRTTVGSRVKCHMCHCMC